MATAGAAILAAAGSATAATPTPTYHAGSDTATFTATGVLDSNCLISTGGTEVWIKPGDAINFKSAVAGINLGSLGLTTGQIAGLNVTAAIDATATSPGQNVSVAAGRTTVFPKSGQAALPSGNHRLTWTMKSIALVPGLLGTLLPPVPLSAGSLRSGASLSWSGVIHVTNDAAQCKIAVGTPQVGVSVGPIKVTVPPINVGVPAPNLPTVPNIPGLPGTGGQPPAGGGHTTPGGGGIHYTPPPLTVPEQAMGRVGTGGGGGFGGAQPDGNSASRIGVNVPQVPVANGSDPQPTDAAGKASVYTKTLGLASNKAPAAQLPVLLAIIAIIALSLVTATYARLYMLRRDS
ncbi:MAG: hypothetical protein ABI775_10880 [Pseudonocardiales bacterium]